LSDSCLKILVGPARCPTGPARELVQLSVRQG
jgi:hypothetical protein